MKSFLILAILAVSAAFSVTQPPATSEGKWHVLFDGKSTEAWRGYRQQTFPTEGWVVENNALRAVAGREGDIVTKDTYRDFELELEWRVSPGANSGVFYRATEDNEYIWQSAPEMQVLDDAKHEDG